MSVWCIVLCNFHFFFFFFQAEDGIRDIGVTGVQTCALPISEEKRRPEAELWKEFANARPHILAALLDAVSGALAAVQGVRTEEGRVGKGGRSRWSPDP